ncbi:MAG: PilN domain-containing protein [Patescibacteria group bacterium]
MITLNLLDQPHRQQLFKEYVFLLLKDITAITLIVVAVIGMLLSISKSILSNDLNETAKRTNVIASNNQPIMQAIRELNDELNSNEYMSQEYTEWSHWLASFSSLVPRGNQIVTMDLQRNERILQIDGKSKTRDDLLKFKANLEASSLIKEIQFPLSNLLLKENIKFKFSVTINPESLTNRLQNSSLE